jgi:hypothetical protein
MKRAEAEWMSKVAALGCIICGAPAQLHHPREGVGKAQRSPNWCVIPLCEPHHTGKNGIHGANFYLMHRRDEWDLLGEVIERLHT